MGWLWGSSDDQSSSPTSSYDSTPLSSSFDSSPPSSFDSSSSSYSDSLSSSGGFDTSGRNESGDPELEKFLVKEQQKAQLQEMIHKMNELCWDTCVTSPESKLSSRTETCISNCVERFVDSSLFITNRFAHFLSKQGGMM